MTPTDTAAAVHRGVLARPEDDNPRLMLADYLDDYAGDGPDPAGWRARAEFIRGQVELARGVKHNHRHQHAGGNAGGCRACRLHRSACRWVESDRGGKAEYRRLFPNCGTIWYGGRGLIADGVGVEFCRGFLDEVRLPLAAWCGERCRHCTDGRFGYPPPETPDCPICDGAGYAAPALGPGVVAAHPVTRVVAVGAEPYLSSEAGYVWWRDHPGTRNASDPAALIPGAVFDHIPGGRGKLLVVCDDGDGTSREAAMRLLSAALVLHARLAAVRLKLVPADLWGG